MTEEPKKKEPFIFFNDSRGDRGGDTYWHETNTLTHIAFVVMFLLGLLSNIFGTIIGALATYYWWGPWMVDFAKEHNRNINWAYFYGLTAGLIGLIIYYVYVKATTDPITTEG